MDLKEQIVKECLELGWQFAMTMPSKMLQP